MTEILAQGPIFLLCVAFLLGVVVIIHELGHYWAGRWFGAAVESFSVGFGQSIFERKDNKGTRWRVNWIPLGGFVKFVGESQLPNDVGKVEDGPQGNHYPELGVGARSIVALAGQAANFVLAILLFALVFGFKGAEQYDLYAYKVNEDGPAAVAGMLPGDVIKAVEGNEVRELADMLHVTSMSSYRPLEFDILRDGQALTLTITPERVIRRNSIGQMVPQGTIGIYPLAVQGSVVYKRYGREGAIV